MTLYISIALLGFVVKIYVAWYALLSKSAVTASLKPSLLAASILFISYSFSQVLLLAPDSWAALFDLERYQVLRLYYYHGTLCLISGIYLCLTLLKFSFHRSIWMLTILSTYGLIAGYFIVSTNWLVNENYYRLPFSKELSFAEVSIAVSLTRLAVVIILTGLLISFIRAYRRSKSNNEQLTNLYAIFAGFIFYLNCVAGLVLAHPLIFSIRGLFFFIALMIISVEKKKFDARGLTPKTSESRASRELESIFRDFSNEDVSYRDAVRLIEKELVKYKLNKVTGFKDSSGSSLPDVAKNMQLSLSSLYDIVKRLGLNRPA